MNQKRKILIVGAGGREHALAWKLSKSPYTGELYCAPGNGGTASIAKNVPIKAEDIDTIVEFAKNNKIDLTVVGPEAPLCKGIVDKFTEQGLKIFGPSKQASQIEGSKSFCKELLHKYGINTPAFKVFDDHKNAIEYIKALNKYPIVIKADGLCAGKGVIIAREESEAIQSIQKIMTEKIFGDAGNKIVIEEFIQGEEVTYMAITDGNAIKPLVTSQDHKALLDNDKGPNTGGMGAYSPAPIVDERLNNIIIREIIEPTLKALKSEGINYMGILYAGLIIRDSIPYVLEYNCRFGDPEAQVVLTRMESDLLELIEACLNERLHDYEIKWSSKASVCVVLASKGYPESYQTGFPIKGLESFDKREDIIIFHAGTKIDNDIIVTSGGRVLGVTALSEKLPDAIDKAYKAIKDINFEGCYYRTDIGKKALKWL